MKSKKTIVISLLLVIILSALSALGVKEADEEIRIALIVPDTVDDKSWSEAMYEGISAAAGELPEGTIKDYIVFENTPPSELASTVKTAVKKDSNIIIIHGTQYRSELEESAAKYPSVMFAFGTSSDVIGDNIITYMPQSEETGYLAGITASLLTKSGKVAIVGPIDGGDAARYNRGFILGVREYNPSIKVTVTHIGNYYDIDKSESTAYALIHGGADILTGSAEQSLGALKAVASYGDEEIWWIGQNKAQLETEEGYKCIASSSYNYKALILKLVENYRNGKKGGECIALNFNNGGFVWEWNDERCSIEIPDEVRRIVDGKVTDLKETPDTLSSWRDVSYSSL